MHDSESPYRSRVIACGPRGAFVTNDGARPYSNNDFLWIQAGNFSDLVLWIIMIVAMMFPLLNESVKQVVFSLKRQQRNAGFFWFIFGYTAVWTAVGLLLLLLLPQLEEWIVGIPLQVKAWLRISGFVLAASLVWFPYRRIQMMKCHQTMPIRINGWLFGYDSLTYGCKIGFACIGLCLPVMVAMAWLHNDMILMFGTTGILITERYCLSHRSKLPGFAWALMALAGFYFAT